MAGMVHQTRIPGQRSQEDPEFTITLSYKVSAGPDDSIGDLILRRRSWAIPALWSQRQEDLCALERPAWSTYQIPSQLRLHSKTLSQKQTNKQTKNQNRKKQHSGGRDWQIWDSHSQGRLH